MADLRLEPSLPAAIAVSTPAARKLSIAAFWISPSQADDVFGPPPRLMLTEATLTPAIGVRCWKT